MLSLIYPLFHPMELTCNLFIGICVFLQTCSFHFTNIQFFLQLIMIYNSQKQPKNIIDFSIQTKISRNQIKTNDPRFLNNVLCKIMFSKQ